jgi:hypothetical protein
MAKKKLSRFAMEAKRLSAQIREGRVLCIDPASGGSLPGYALFQNSVWIESGEIQMSKRKQQPHQRYRQLLLALQSNEELFQNIDVLCIEYIPPFMGSRGGDFRTQGVINLHRSVSIFMAAIEYNSILEIPSTTWHAWVREHVSNYEKSDMKDATVMGLTLFSAADTPISNFEEVLELVKTK